MWEPKTEEELNLDKKEREKTAKICGIIIFSLFLILEILQNKFLGTQAYRGASLGPTMTWIEIIRIIPRLSLFSSIFGILVYLSFRKFNNYTTQICTKCGKLKRYNKKEDCDCGGKFRLINEMKWVEDSKKIN